MPCLACAPPLSVQRPPLLPVWRWWCRGCACNSDALQPTIEGPYKTLGVGKSASAAEIKKAFRKKAIDAHRTGSQTSPVAGSRRMRLQAKFRAEVGGEAYEILKDPVQEAGV